MLSIAFAKKCAWRAVYISVHGRQVFHLGIDPTTCTGAPILFAGVNDDTWYRSLRLRLPALRWHRKPARGTLRERIWLAIYQRQQRALYALDGRF